LDVLASSMEAYFDFDTEVGEDPKTLDGRGRLAFTVVDRGAGNADILRRCFRFRYEPTWHDYYEKAQLSLEEKNAVAHHALGTIAIDVPVLLAFCLLLSTRPGLPRRPIMLERLNRSRAKAGKTRLLDHVEVSSPVLQEYGAIREAGSQGPYRRCPRLHHVRGHLVRHGSHLFWRVPHLRGSARAGIVRTRTVTWTMDPPQRPNPALPITRPGSQSDHRTLYP
jgi:hypothetical protein